MIRRFYFYYRPGNERCETCHWMKDDGSCPIVGGQVSPEMVCDAWRKMRHG